MHNMRIRKLNSLGVTKVGHSDLIDLCDENFKVLRKNLGLITQKKWVTTNLLPIYFI